VGNRGASPQGEKFAQVFKFRPGAISKKLSSYKYVFNYYSFSLKTAALQKIERKLYCTKIDMDQGCARWNILKPKIPIWVNLRGT
jgi:hypothetical protein